jgi:ribosomal protein S18 acetylase RimI-like enzyme
MTPEPSSETFAATGGITVRPAAPHELDAAGQAVYAAYLADGTVRPQYRETLLATHDRARDAEIAIAVDAAGRVLGCVTFAVPGSRWAELSKDGEAEFRMLGVHPAAQGRGVGSALVRWCLARAVELGRHRVVLCSGDAMHAAHALYERLGFARRPDLDWSPLPGVDLVGFSIDLAETGDDATTH